MADTDKAQEQPQPAPAPAQPVTVQVVQPKQETGTPAATPGLDETVEGGDYILPDGRHVNANGEEIKKAQAKK